MKKNLFAMAALVASIALLAGCTTSTPEVEEETGAVVEETTTVETPEVTTEETGAVVVEETTDATTTAE